MSLEVENELYQLRTAVQKLSRRVDDLEKRFSKPKFPLKKRAQMALFDSDNDLAQARDRARDNEDTELVEYLEKLMRGY
jgi:hypothetical protein